MTELQEQMACKEAEASATIKGLSERLETIDAEINEEREKRRVFPLQFRSFIFFHGLSTATVYSSDIRKPSRLNSPTVSPLLLPINFN